MGQQELVLQKSEGGGLPWLAGTLLQDLQALTVFERTTETLTK